MHARLCLRIPVPCRSYPTHVGCVAVVWSYSSVSKSSRREQSGWWCLSCDYIRLLMAWPDMEAQRKRPSGATSPFPVS